MLGDDKKSVRAFETSIDGQDLEFFLQVDAPRFKLIDKETGSEWDFGGKATNGSLQGSQLEKIYVLRDSWFNWKAHNPNAEIYLLGAR